MQTLIPNPGKWASKGKCYTAGKNKQRINDFFSKYEASVETDGIEARLTDSLCKSCPVQRTCLASGISNKEYGVWGGVYLEAGKLSEKYNAHKSPDDWADVFMNITMT